MIKITAESSVAKRMYQNSILRRQTTITPPSMLANRPGLLGLDWLDWLSVPLAPFWFGC